MTGPRPGYKQTEVGAVPEEWDVEPLGDIMKFQNGFNADKAAYGAGTPFINVLEVITHTHLTPDRIPGRVTVTKPQFGTFEVRRGDVLFNRTSETQEEIALAASYDHDEPVIFGGFVIRGRPDATRLHPRFGGYGLRSPVVRNQLIARGQGVVRANIGQGDLKKVLVPLPGKGEQESIADALSDADALIDALAALIAKKRDLKLGAMQLLLSGERRLPGFAGDWESEPLGGLGRWQGGATPSMSRTEFWAEGTIPWVSSSDVRPGAITPRNLITRRAVRESSTTVVEPGAILMVTRSGILRRFLPIAMTSTTLAINQDIKALTPRDDVVGEFVFHALALASQNILGSCMSSGTTVESVELSSLKKFEILLPPTRDEQRAVATVLSDMDAEISALEARLQKARGVKRGMMQVLLTGEIRLT